MPHRSGRSVNCRHSSQKSGRALHLGHATRLDTNIKGNRWHTCPTIETGCPVQAVGRFRVRALEPIVSR